MKYLIPIFILLLIACNCKSQDITSTEAVGSSNIYYAALTRFVESNCKDCKEILIEKDELITDKLPAKIGNCVVNFVDVDFIDEILKQKIKLTLFHVIPLRVKDGEFFVNIISFDVQKESDHFRYINTGGAKVVFYYEKQKFVFNRIE